MRFRTLRGYSTEGRNNVRAALALPAMLRRTRPGPRALRRRRARMNQGDYAEAKDADRVPRRSASLGDTRDIAAALSDALDASHAAGRIGKARECEEEAIELFRELGDSLGEAIGLLNLGEIAVRQADHGGAGALFEQVLAIARTSASGAGKRMRAQPWRARVQRGQPAGGAGAVRARLRSAARGGQAGRGDRPVVPWQGRRRARIPRVGARNSPTHCLPSNRSG